MSLLGRVIDLLRRSFEDTVDIADYKRLDAELQKEEDRVQKELMRVQFIRFSLNEAMMAYHCCDRATVEKELKRVKTLQ